MLNRGCRENDRQYIKHLPHSIIVRVQQQIGASLTTYPNNNYSVERFELNSADISVSLENYAVLVNYVEREMLLQTEM